MITPLDAVTLAYTKLRTRKVRTAFTVLISGLLFGILCAALLIAAGVLDSVEKFGREGVGEKYIVYTEDGSTYDLSPRYEALAEPSVLNRVKQLHADRVNTKTAEAKALNIEYDTASEDPPLVTKDEATKKEFISEDKIDNPLVAQALDEYLKPTIKKFNPTAEARDFGLKRNVTEYIISPTDGQFLPMQSGKEDAIASYGKVDPAKQNFDMSYESLFTSFQSMSIEDDALAMPYVIREFDPKTATKIPIIVPFSYAESALELKKLPGSSTADERLERIKEVRSRIDEISLDFCYRNSTSQSLLNRSLETRAEIEKNKTDKKYTQPNLLYGVPEESSCATPQIISDTRTTDERAYTDKQAIFDKKFNGETDPVSTKLSFQVIGLSPSASNITSSQSLADGIALMFSAGSVPHWQIPAGMFINLPTELKQADVFGAAADATKTTDIPSSGSSAVLEFTTLDGAQRYIKSNECFGSCDTYAYAYANNTILMDDIQGYLRTIVYWMALIISVIATILLGSMIGRTVADGRRETAVFRAIGAKRIDILSIYIWYTLLLSLRVIIFVFLLGTILALAAHYWLAPNITIQALVVFAAQDLNLKFSLISLNSLYLLYLPLLIIGISLLAMIFPMLTSIRRNPIQDMRQE